MLFVLVLSLLGLDVLLRLRLLGFSSRFSRLGHSLVGTAKGYSFHSLLLNLAHSNVSLEVILGAKVWQFPGVAVVFVDSDALLGVPVKQLLSIRPAPLFKDTS